MTGAYALLTVLDIVFGIRANSVLDMVTLLAFVVATFAISGLGINAVQKCNKYAAYLFGAFSVLVLGYLVVDTDWSAVFDRSAGSVAAMITGVGLIAAGGVSWIPSAPTSPGTCRARRPRRGSSGSRSAVRASSYCRWC